ncbi:MAG: 30S ribosomal protein S20 [bacterium]
MANHKATKKSIRKTEIRRLENKYYARTMRNAVKKLKNESDKNQAATELPKVTSIIDKVVKRNIIHKNKASHLKSQLMKHVNTL